MVKLYLTTETSHQDLALKFEISNPPLITKWVNAYRIAGLDALQEKARGRPSNMSKTRKKIKIGTEDNKDKLIQLEEEKLKSIIENSYLKESRRLCLDREAQSKKRESLVIFEEVSD